MEAKDDKLNPHQSLELITAMVRQAQGNVSNNSFYFLLWGWVIAACNFGMYYFVKFTAYKAYAPMVWLLCIPASIITGMYGSRHRRATQAITHLERINMWVWIGLMICIFPMFMFGPKLNWMINAVLFLPIALCTFISGIILRFKPLIVGGAVLWICAVACFIVGPVEQYVVGGIAMILGYLVPGYMLRNLKR
jgi:hypothetical protein